MNTQSTVSPTHSADHLGYIGKKLLGQEDAFLRKHMGMSVARISDGMGEATLALPAHLRDLSQAQAFLVQSGFPPHIKPQPASHTAAAQDVSFSVTLSIYDLKRLCDRIKKPVGYRAHPTRSADERLVMEEEFRILMGLDAPPKQKEMETLVQDLGMTRALDILTRDYSIMFADTLKGGMYHFPIRHADSLIARYATALKATGTFADNDMRIESTHHNPTLIISPSALSQLQEHLFSGGIQHQGATLPSVLSPAADTARRRRFSLKEADDALRELLTHHISALTPGDIAQVQQSLAASAAKLAVSAKPADALPHDRASLHALSDSVETLLKSRESSARTTPPFDQAAMRSAITTAMGVLGEDRLWTHLTNAQLASGHNTIREDHREALTQLSDLLGSHQFSQQSLGQLIAMPRFANALRDSGHFISLVAQHAMGKPAGKHITGDLPPEAAAYAQAFHLLPAALVPQSAEAKSASYHLREMVGKVGVGEVIAKNALMGLRPIVSSVELAIQKPVLCGATILGIAAYSSMVPKKYSIPRMINKLMHNIIEGLGIPHGHDSAGAKKMLQTAENAIDDIRKTGTAGNSFWKGFNTGRKFGVGQTAAIASGAFIAFNIVEDVVVHLPLALVSVGVGAAGGATGRKVLKPVIDDLGDIAGRFSPQPVRDAFRQDSLALQQLAEQPWLSRISQGATTLSRDLDDFGIIVTGRHIASSAISGLQQLVGRVLGEAQPARHAPSTSTSAAAAQR